MRLRPLPLNHQIGCPTIEHRIETYESDAPEGRFTVTRCGDCGAHATRKQGS